MLRRFVAALAAMLLAAPAANAADTFVYARAGTNGADATRDSADCVKRIADAGVYYQQGITWEQAWGVGGLVAVGLNAAIQPALTRDSRARSLQVCMRHRGYARVPLGDDEAVAYRALSSDAARETWMDGFLARGDIDARARAALTPRYLPLPPAQDLGAPWTVGASRIDPASLSLTSGPVGKGGALMDGKLSRRAVAVLTQDFKGHSGILSFHAPAGTEFQEYYWPPPWDPNLSEDKTAWCAKFKGDFGLMCFRSRLDGYSLVLVKLGEPWLVGWADPEPFNVEAAYHFSMNLAAPTADTQAPLDFHVTFGGVAQDRVKLTATAVKDGKSVEFWAWALPFDADGKARLPCWDRTLVFTRVGDAVTAAFEPRADGKGWVDLQEPAARANSAPGGAQFGKTGPGP